MSTQIISSGASVSNLVVSGGLIVTVSSGGTLTSAMVQSGGSVSVLAGGTDSGSVVSSGGTMLVSGGVASGELIFGAQSVLKGAVASGELIYGSQLVSSSTVSNETIENGGTVQLLSNSLTAIGLTVLSGGTLLISKSAVASNTTLSGGTVSLLTPAATLSGSLTFVNGGTLNLVQLGTAPATAGTPAIISGFDSGSVILLPTGTTLTAATVVSGNTVVSATSATSTDVLTFAGSALAAQLSSTTLGGLVELYVPVVASGVTSIGSGTTTSGLVVNSGGSATVYNGGTLASASVLSGGVVTVLSGGLDQGSIIASGASETVLGTASGVTVSGTQTLSGAAAVDRGVVVASGGTLAVNGGIASGTTVQAGGVVTVSGTGAIAGGVIAGGTLDLLSTQATFSGIAFSGPGSLVLATVPAAGAGEQGVISGFYYNDSVTLSGFGAGATSSVTTSGGNTLVTITSGAVSETLTFQGAIAGQLAVTSSGGAEVVSYNLPPTTSGYVPGNLVISVYGNGANTGIVTLDQAAPITLQQVTTTGTIVDQLVLPETTTVQNGVTEYAISGEYQSASEGILALSADGRSLVIAGYGVNDLAFNAANAGTIYGATALGQTTSLLGGQYTAVNRVYADISFTGSIDTSTSLSGVFNTNNPRSVATVNGSTFYVGGQGNGNDGTAGVFLATQGASTATPIYNTLTDVRDVELYNGQLYVSVDSKLNGGGGLYTFAGLPTGAQTPTLLPGFSHTITLQAGQGNSVNAAAIGQSVYLSPEQYFFANATTVYVADGGVPKEGGIGDGGLQKWSLSGGVWTLDYTLSQGLNQVANSAASGTTGLVGLTGTISGSSVILYTSNETVAETDPTFLYTITDDLAATSLPASESFTQLMAAAPGTLIRGVAFAPTSNTAGQVTGAIAVSGGVTSSGLVLGSGGTVEVQSGGTISATTVLAGGRLTIDAGAADSGSVVANGGTAFVGGSASQDSIAGYVILPGSGTVSGETVNNGGDLQLYGSGATATGTVVNIGGTLVVSGATASSTTIIGGLVDLQSVDATLAGVTFVGNGGTLLIEHTTLSGAGVQGLISGYTASDVIDARAMGAGTVITTALSGGNTVATLSSGGVTQTLTFAGSAYAGNLASASDLLGGTELIYTPPAPVVITVSSGVVSGGLTIGSAATVIVLSGGTMSGFTIQSGGSAVVSAGGVDSGSTVLSGGFETVDGAAIGDQIYGIQNVTTGPGLGTLPATIANETVYNGGTIQLFLKPDTAVNTIVSSGGSLLLSGNVSATDTTLEAGAYMALQSPKAVLSGGLVFSGAATLAITAATTSAGYGVDALVSGAYVGATISGFGQGDIIDITAVSLASASFSTSVVSGNTVAVVSGGTYPDYFVFAGTTIVSSLALISDGGTGVEIVTCFREGTRIATTQGDVTVEALRVGDLVRTASGALRPIVWIGHRTIACDRHPEPERAWPVRIAAGAFDDGLPARDLDLSPEHAVFAHGVLIPVFELINGETVRQLHAASVTYWHIELDSHDIVLAEGLPVESYLENGNRQDFEGGAALSLHAMLRGSEGGEACAPIMRQGPVLELVRGMLALRCSALAA